MSKLHASKRDNDTEVRGRQSPFQLVSVTWFLKSACHRAMRRQAMSSNQMSKGQVFIPNKTSTYFKSSFLPMLVQKSFSLVPKTVQLGKMSVKPHVKFRSALKCTFFCLHRMDSDSVYMWTQNSVERLCWWFLQVRMLRVPLLRCAQAIKRSLSHKNK